ncbi:MAG: large repetitive protein [Frankiaceae bacterium]|nr:large repetitive protein [Frankiaceae bacterium]
MKLTRYAARALAVSWTICLVAVVAPAAQAAKPSTRPAAPVLATTPAALTNATSASFTWAAVPSATSYSCSRDGAKAVTCVSGVTYTGLTSRSHTFSVRTITGGGKAGTSAPTSYSWTVDTIAPAAPTVAAPPSPTRNTQVSVGFSDSDASVASYTCALDGAAATTCATPFTAAGLGSGSHTLVVAARDAAGNATAATPVTWVVDLSAPLAAVVTAPPAYTASTSVSVPFSSDDLGAAYACSLDGAAGAACVSPFTASGLGEGAHSLTISATDGVGNVGSPVTVVWIVDVTAPVAPRVVTGPAPRTNQHPGTVVFTLPEAATTAECRADADAWAACTSPWTTAALIDGDHTISLRAVDRAGNRSSISPTTFTVDSTAPAPAQILTGPADPSNVPSPIFALVETDPSTLSFECSLDGAPVVDCTTPDPYTVDVSGDGQHVLSVVALDGPPADPTTNRSAAVSWTWMLDTVAPAAPEFPASLPALTGSSVTIPIKTDPSATTTCMLDGNAIPCGTAISVAGLTNGGHVVQARSTDEAGNASSAQHSWTVDATAPTVTVTNPTTTTGSTAVGFSEDVLGATAVALQVVGDTTHKNVAAQSCRSSAGAVVSCTGAVRTVLLTPVGSLIPGQSYVVYVAPTVRDAAGNSAGGSPAGFRANRLAEESSRAVVQSWKRIATSSAYGGSYLTEHSAGASVNLVFTGTMITWYTVTGPAQGTARVYVDNVLKATTNNYAAAAHYKVARTVKGLKAGTHTLKVVVTGLKGSKLGKDTSVSVDAVRVGTVSINGTPSLVQLWRAASASGHRWAVDNLAGSSITMRFRGTAISLATVLGPDRGLAEIRIDGKTRLTFDGYSSAVRYGVLKTVSGLTNTVHTVTVVVTGKKRAASKGTWVAVDFLRVA